MEFSNQLQEHNDDNSNSVIIHDVGNANRFQEESSEINQSGSD
jgi:hypothetical protein